MTTDELNPVIRVRVSDFVMVTEETQHNGIYKKYHDDANRDSITSPVFTIDKQVDG